MAELLENRIYCGLLLAVILGEFFLPWILKHFYKGYDSRTMVMSVLGCPESPVRVIYNFWLIGLGLFLLFTAFVLYAAFRSVSPVLAILIFLSATVFAVGAGLLAGIFSVNAARDRVSTASKIHGAGSAVGFMFLLFFPLLCGIAELKRGDPAACIICILSFAAALLCFVCFILGDKEQFRKTILSCEGLWERLTLFFMYVPFLLIAYRGLFS